MGYHIGLQLEVTGKIHGKVYEVNFDLEYGDKSINFLDLNKYDKRTLVFKVKRKGYPYGGSFINKIIDENDEAYDWIVKYFGNIKGRFTYDVIDVYNNIFDLGYDDE